MYIDKLADIVGEYNNTIKMKPIHVNSNTYIEFGMENNDKSP